MLMLQVVQEPPWGEGEYWLLHVVALLVVLGVIVTIYLFRRREDKSADSKIGIWSAFGVVGKDNRVSTSKLQVMMWTVFVPAALLSIVLHAWRDLWELGQGISVPADYLFLLGFPIGTAIASKTITTTKVASGAIPKPDAEVPPDLSSGVVQSVGNDDGSTEIFDLQYLLFNVVALIFFLATFVSQYDDADGLLEFPEIPAGLLILTGTSAAGYLSRKALETERPSITGIYPQTAAQGEDIWLRGANLTIRTQPNGILQIKGITFGGLPAEQWAPAQGDDEYTAKVPMAATPGLTEVRVVRGDGVVSDKEDVTVLEARPDIESVYPAAMQPTQRDAGKKVTVLGTGFGPPGPDGRAPEGAAVLLAGRPLEIRAWHPERIDAVAPTENDAKLANVAPDTVLNVEVVNARGKKSEPKTVVLV